MASLSHEPLPRPQPRPTLVAMLGITEMWASLAIVVIWLAVLFTGIYGPDIVSQSAGGDHTTLPSVAVVAIFAAIATWVVARYGFRHDNR